MIKTTTRTLWSVHILERELVFTDAVDTELATLAKEYCKSIMSTSNAYKSRADIRSMFAAYPDSAALQEYFKSIKSAASDYCGIYGLKSDDLECEYNTFANVEGLADWGLLHGHFGNQLVVTYYPEVIRGRNENPKGGKVQFHRADAAMSSWMLGAENSCAEYSPRRGTQLVFPGHVKHTTTPFFDSTSSKTAIITNVRFHGIKMQGQATYLSEKEILSAGIPRSSNQGV